MLRRSLLSGTIHAISLVQGAHNPSDALSKPSYARPAPNPTLTNTLLAGRLHVPVISCTTSSGYRNAPRDAAPSPRRVPRPPAPARATRGEFPPPRATSAGDRLAEASSTSARRPTPPRPPRCRRPGRGHTTAPPHPPRPRVQDDTTSTWPRLRSPRLAYDRGVWNVRPTTDPHLVSRTAGFVRLIVTSPA